MEGKAFEVQKQQMLRLVVAVVYKSSKECHECVQAHAILMVVVWWQTRY
jgi:hypothetical protein